MPTQDNRPMRLKTPLGPDALLMTHFQGGEQISQLFSFQVAALAALDKPADFSKILGQPVSVELDAEENTRYFHGIVSRFSQGRRDQVYIHYRLEIVPPLWLLTQTRQSRIFQQITVPDILNKVLEGQNVRWEIEGSFAPRDYCVQYRESDFDFASRLMEEEGIYYYFLHEESGVTMVVANTPTGHVPTPIADKLIYEEVRGGNRPEGRIVDWVKSQSVRPGKVLLWDHCFELPEQHLDAEKKLIDSVTVGKVTHKIQLGGVTDKLEQYDYPGGYAQRFDGIDPGGGDRAGDLNKIFEDNERTAEIRAQEWLSGAIAIQGRSFAAQLTSGHKFTLDRHADADGDYVLTEVQHSATLTANYRSGEGELLDYSNQFTCIPAAVPFRPTRRTPRPVMYGTQTAVVTGPSGEEIFTDKYGRIKVQFHWDREGKLDANSSCWVRVATIWAGKTWGVIHIPRIGQEVVIAFEEGDPDRPLVVGSVYNADQMPPGTLPDDKMISGSRTNSTIGGGGFNGMISNDTKGAELVAIHAQYNMDTVVENDQTTTVHNNRTDVIDVDDSETVGGNQTLHVVKDQTVNIDMNRTETVGINESITIVANRTRSVGGNESVSVAMARTHTVGAAEAISIGGAQSLVIGAGQSVAIAGSAATTVGGNQTLKVANTVTVNIDGDRGETIKGKRTDNIGKDLQASVGGSLVASIGKDELVSVGKNFQIEAGDKIVLKTGDASITLKKNGTIMIQGKNITIKGSGKINVKADGDVIVKGSTIKEN